MISVPTPSLPQAERPPMSSVNPPASVEDRVQSLERQNQILMGVAVAALFVVALLLLVVEGQINSIPGYKPQFGVVFYENLGVKQLQADQLIIPGVQPGSKLLLTQSTQGTPFVGLYDRDKERMTLSLNAQGSPTIDLRDTGGTARLSASLTVTGEPSMVLSDKGSKLQVSIAVEDNGSSAIRFKGPSDQAALIGLSGEIGPSLLLEDGSEKSSIMMSTNSGNLRLNFNDRTGIRIGLATKTGEPATVSVSGPGGAHNGAAGLSVDSGGVPSVIVMDKNKKYRSFQVDPAVQPPAR